MAGASVEELELQHVIDRKRSELQEVGSKAGSGWLAPTAGTEQGTAQLYAALERQAQSDAFAEALARSQHDARRGGAAAPVPASCEVLSQDWWEVKGDGELRVAEQTGEYVLVEREDVVRALSAFIAEYLVSLPEARDMEPRQLQRAVALTMAELRKGRVRRLLDWGKSLYRLGALGYGAFSAFTNPWVAKAVLAALWSCLRLMGRLMV